MTTNVWFNDPSVLFQKKEIFDVWPSTTMTQAKNINAITRLVILLTIIGFALTRRIEILVSALITIVIMWFVSNKNSNNNLKEGLESLREVQPKIVIEEPEFTKPKQNNPMMNVLIPEIQDNPKRESAEPAFDPNVEEKINDCAQNFAVEQFNNDPKIKELLFSDLSDKMVFDQSMRNFYANPSTTIPNDQGAFAQFCYGEAVSCKENNALACERNSFRKYPTV